MPPKAAVRGAITRWRLPAKVMVPALGWYTPLMMFKRLLFPAPLGPMMAHTSRSRTWKLT